MMEEYEEEGCPKELQNTSYDNCLSVSPILICLVERYLTV